MRLFIYLLICLFIGCKNPNYKLNNNRVIRESVLEADTIIKKNESIQLFDTLLIKQVKFNKNNFSLKYSYLKKKKADSIVETYWECGNPFEWEGEMFNYYYIQGARYVTNQKEAFLNHANFIGNNQLSISDTDIVLNKETTLRDFRIIFKNLEIIEIEEGFAVYNITFNPSQPEDNWHFYFNKEGFLIAFYLDWWLC